MLNYYINLLYCYFILYVELKKKKIVASLFRELGKGRGPEFETQREQHSKWMQILTLEDLNFAKMDILHNLKIFLKKDMDCCTWQEPRH